MLLCDVGNTTYHFYDLNKEWRENVATFDPSAIEEEVFFISVNTSLKQQLSQLRNWNDLEEKIDRMNYYETMGIDRIVACEAVNEGVIVDAGSAITVDIVRDGRFQGGFIYPGMYAFAQTYQKISPALAYPIDGDIDLSILPKNSKDALNYGFLSGLVKEILSHKLDIILTGGDADVLKKHLPNAHKEPLLIFNGMLNVLGRELC